MCWSTNSYPVKKIANEPIKVYKWLEPGFISPYTEYKYKLNSLNKFIKLHCTSHQYYNVYAQSVFIAYTINEGYHSYESLDIAMGHHFPHCFGLYECEIPIGAEYYDNGEDGEIVSSNIIIRKVIDNVLETMYKTKEADSLKASTCI